MRRGHPNAGGWRSDNHRNFRPRTGGPTQFRPYRGYLLDANPRFPSPGTRGFHRPPHHGLSGHRDSERNSYHFNQARPQSHRQILPYLQQLRQNRTDQNINFKQSEPPFHVNTMGDVDFRHNTNDSQPTQGISPWAVPPFEMRQQNQMYERRPFRRESIEHNRLPPSDYGGHRPHSSDYYDNNSTPDIDKSNSFTHSIDDTVDIIRKRLQNRSEPQQNSEQQHNEVDYEHDLVPESSTNQPQQEGREDGGIRKRIQRQKSNVKVNCDKMKNKIVHQLFKMDKDKIHKLMDNPNSSSKFEFAISSLITESQNSFNRHMRSVAEKSLCSSSSEFIHHDNNTVYEDTFMKQMQCILDPQDTILLEDIKPLVMAEINNLLQLDEYDHRLESQEYSSYENVDHLENYDANVNTDEFTGNQYDYQTFSESEYGINEEQQEHKRELIEDYAHPQSPPDAKPLFESTQWDNEKPGYTAHQSNPRRSIDQSNETKRAPTPLPLFDPNTEQFSEDDDPFAELDKQYHVAVDHNFIEEDYSSPQQTPYNRNETYSPNTTKSTLESPVIPERSKEVVKKEIDSQLLELATSPLKLSKNSDTQLTSPKKEITHDNFTEEFIRKENIPVSKSTENTNTVSKTSLQPNSRKRTADQKPSHRKEKRKKNEPNDKDLNKQILNKNIIINVNDCSAKASEKCESAKSIFNLFFSKDQSNKNAPHRDNKSESSKEYSNKYVKRKEIVKKNKNIDDKKKPNLSISCHSIEVPTVKNDTGQTPTKTDPKTKLKTFDLFEQQPRKLNVQHQSIRNTAAAPSITPKEPTKPNKDETKSGGKTKRHVAVQTAQYGKQLCKGDSKGTQTISPRHIKKSTQTLPVTITKEISQSTDPFERMKEIDLEIQNLLQEKFKLYSSLESKNKAAASMQDLGMTVLNVTPTPEDNSINEDTIVDDFANIPVEELEQIALETVQEETSQSIKKTKRQRTVSKDINKSQTPHSRSRSRSKKVSPPNISLIEQIISDDRPLEEIVPLDELEPETPRSRFKKTCSKKKSIGNKKSRNIDSIITNEVPARPQIKECHIVLIREDLNKKLEKFMKNSRNESRTVSTPVSDEVIPAPVKNESTPEKVAEVEGNVVNDLQIDMLDVSEDIVIGDDTHSDVKDEKVVDRIDLSVTEEIILDNSQSSVGEEECVTSQTTELCKIYDFSADENLRRDCTIVTGNADAVLAIECIEKDFIAACLDGNVYHFGGNGQLLNTLRGSNLAVTCLTIVKEKYGTTIYTGSLDSRIRYYDLETGLEKGPECNVLSPIQTMDRAWDTIFVGTRTGFVLQFECKNNMLIPVSTIKFSDQAILALRALKEGPRKVLLVAARSENVTIKDAVTGLLLRTLEGPKMTIYTLLFEDGKVYCGTSSHQIHVFDYASGGHMQCHGGGKGAVVLRAAGGLLFAGCYDGGVYVFRRDQPAPRAVLRGPKLMLLSLAVRHTEIIAGYKDRSLYIWKIPLAILQEMVL